MSKFIFFTNIPTPYRVSFYNDLYRNNLDFKVYFMRITELDRNWVINKNEFKFPFFIDKGIYFMLGRFHFHINFYLIYKIIKEKNSNIIIGGSWNDINVIILVILKKIGLINSKLHFWSEANFLTIGALNDNFLKFYFRKFIFNTCDGFQLLSGRMTELTLKKWNVNYSKSIFLPNTIEEEAFQICDLDINQRLSTNLPKFIIPVRLIENIKGIINYFEKLGIKNILKAKFYIAGDGPDRNLIQKFIDTNKLNNHIFLLGHVNSQELANIYKVSNALILPSFSDPSPLTVIEALYMKLPIILSNRCGNHFEALIENLNGYLFDPDSSESIQKSFVSFLNNRILWEKMGSESFDIYLKIFNRKDVVKNFVSQLNHI